MWNRDRRREGGKGGFRLEIESSLIWAALMNGLEVNCKLTKIFLLVFPLCCSNLQFQMLSPYPVKWSHNDRPTERTEKPNTYKSRNGHYQKCDMWSQYLNQWHGSGLTMSWKGNELSPQLRLENDHSGGAETETSQYKTIEMAQGNTLKRQGGLGQRNCRVSLRGFLLAKLSEQTVRSSGKTTLL